MKAKQQSNIRPEGLPPNLYGLEERTPPGITITAALQWFFIILSSSLVIPLVIGEIYGLPTERIGQFVQQTYFFIGLLSLLQVWAGHRLPIPEGPAGMWWGIFIILAGFGPATHQTAAEIGQSLQTGLILTGIMLVILAVTGVIGRLQKYFTPPVTGTYLVLLAVSLCSSVMKGLLGIGYFSANEGVDPGITVVSIGLVLFTFLMIRSPYRYIRGFAILISLLAGWLTFALLGWTKPVAPAGHFFSLPVLFFWGPPRIHYGTILTCLLTGLILIINLIASISVVAQAAQVKAGGKEYKKGGVVTGVAHILSGVGGIVGLVPVSIAAGVIQVSRIASRTPYILSCFLLILFGLITPLSRFLAALPSPVGCAVMFVTFIQLLGFGLQDYGRIKMTERNIYAVGFGLMSGIGLMFIPAEALKTLPPLISYVCGNGLVTGVLVTIFLEHLVMREKPAS